MPRFFVPPFSGEETAVTGEDGRHIARSLRMKVGEPLTLCDGQGTDYQCEITGFSGEEVRVRVLERSPSQSEPSIRVTVYQGIPKGDKMDAIVQKAVELGAAEIVPVAMRRCVSRPDEKSAVKKPPAGRKSPMKPPNRAAGAFCLWYSRLWNLEKPFAAPRKTARCCCSMKAAASLFRRRYRRTGKPSPSLSGRRAA